MESYRVCVWKLFGIEVCNQVFFLSRFHFVFDLYSTFFLFAESISRITDSNKSILPHRLTCVLSREMVNFHSEILV